MCSLEHSLVLTLVATEARCRYASFWNDFFLKFLLDTCPFLGPLIPSGFQSQSGFCLIGTLRRRTWYTFPEIHLWCDTSAGVYSPHSSQSLSPHVCFSRGRMPDLNHRPPAWQADVLTTRPQRPGSFWNVFLFYLLQFQNYFCLMTGNYRPQGKVMFSQVAVSHYVHAQPHGYSVTAHPCYGAVGTHLTGMLSWYHISISR